MWVWWISLALLAIVIELHSQTIYLLALATALGLGAASVALHFGLAGQAAVIGIACLAGFPLAARYKHHLAGRARPVEADIGQEVRVVTTQPLRVAYRGSEWDAVYMGMQGAQAAGLSAGDKLRIAALRGSVLELKAIQ